MAHPASTAEVVTQSSTCAGLRRKGSAAASSIAARRNGTKLFRTLANHGDSDWGSGPRGLGLIEVWGARCRFGTPCHADHDAVGRDRLRKVPGRCRDDDDWGLGQSLLGQ